MNQTPVTSQILNKAVSEAMRIAQETTCQEFNDMLTQFLAALSKAFAKVPEINSQIALHTNILEQLLVKDKTFVLVQFTKCCGDFFSGFENADREQFIASVLPVLTVFRGFRLTDYWDRTPEKTRKTIWKYMQNLWMYCQQYKQCQNEVEITSNAMKMIESDQFEKLMKKTLESLSDIAPEILANLNPNFSRQISRQNEQEAHELD